MTVGLLDCVATLQRPLSAWPLPGRTYRLCHTIYSSILVARRRCTVSSTPTTSATGAAADCASIPELRLVQLVFSEVSLLIIKRLSIQTLRWRGPLLGNDPCRTHCTNRLSKLRCSLKFKQGRQRYVGKALTPDMVTDSRCALSRSGMARTLPKAPHGENRL
jgi:hypothetical protein